MRKITFIAAILLLTSACVLTGCNQIGGKNNIAVLLNLDSLVIKTLPKKVSSNDIVLKKEFLYDQHTLADTYPYKDTTREFQWDKVKKRLAYLENIQQRKSKWAILQNYKNQKGEAPVVRKFVRNDHGRVADTLGVERYQSVPMYLPEDEKTPELYGRDGSLARIIAIDDSSKFVKVENMNYKGHWLVPRRYVKPINDTIVFNKAIFIDLTNQNIATAEKADSIWLIRSMNPATTGLHRPPYQQETPVGLFVIQERKAKMYFLKDGTTQTGGFAPWASRVTNGAYIHGIPINLPRTTTIEFSPSLGTTPRSHMCIRNATSHAKFVYDWATIQGTIIFVFD